MKKIRINNADFSIYVSIHLSFHKLSFIVLLLDVHEEEFSNLNFYLFLVEELLSLCSLFTTSLQARSADLPASPAGLLGRFAPSGFALCARISLASLAHVSRFALTKIFEKKKCVSIDSKCSETRKNAKKNFFTPFDPLRASRVARSSRKFSKKISVSQSTRNTLKRIEMQ